MLVTLSSSFVLAVAAELRASRTAAARETMLSTERQRLGQQGSAASLTAQRAELQKELTSVFEARIQALRIVSPRKHRISDCGTESSTRPSQAPRLREASGNAKDWPSRPPGVLSDHQEQ